MEPKKSKKADVDRNRMVFFEIGLVLTLLLVIVAFQWKKSENKLMKISYNLQLDDDQEQADVTKQKDQPPPPPPPPQIEEVKNDEKIQDDQPKVQSVESSEETVVAPPKIQVKESVKEEQPFVFVEDMPTFPGGNQAMYDYLQNHIQYPNREKQLSIQGKVVVSFIVEKDGSITHVKVVRSVSPGLDAEAVKVVQGMPNWNPGKQRKVAVRVKINLPIDFKLQQ